MPGKTVRLTAYLTFDRSKILGTRKSVPDLRAGEHAIRIQLEVPEGVFRHDLPTAVVTVHEPEVIHPTVDVLPAPEEPPSV